MNAPLPRDFARLQDSEAEPFGFGRLWSLWDMIDLQLRDFLYAMDLIGIAKCRAETARQDEPIKEDKLAIIGDNLARIKHYCEEFEMRTALYRVNRLKDLLGGGCYGDHLALEIKELFDAVQFDANDEYFCHYDKSRVGYIRNVEYEWKDVFTAFPSAKDEIVSGLDCYALGHKAACVFHMSRVGEIGLLMIGRERGWNR
jgi:hypothetical protein